MADTNENETIVISCQPEDDSDKTVVMAQEPHSFVPAHADYTVVETGFDGIGSTTATGTGTGKSVSSTWSR